MVRISLSHKVSQNGWENNLLRNKNIILTIMRLRPFKFNNSLDTLSRYKISAKQNQVIPS